MTAETIPTGGHTMRVTLDCESVRLEPVCHEPEGAVCRVTCARASDPCESWDYPDHEHGLIPIPDCNAVEWLTAGDVECQCDSSVPVPLSDGMPIEVAYDSGRGYTWAPVKIPVTVTT